MVPRVYIQFVSKCRVYRTKDSKLIILRIVCVVEQLENVVHLRQDIHECGQCWVGCQLIKQRLLGAGRSVVWCVGFVQEVLLLGHGRQEG